jgi:hypothetical protein
MKIKINFITNSSSTAYLITGDDHILKNIVSLLRHYKVRKRDIEEFKYFDARKRIEPLKKYHFGRELDWVDKATGYDPEYGKLGSKDMYKDATNQILNNKSVAIIVVDHNSHAFEVLSDQDVDIIRGESD